MSVSFCFHSPIFAGPSEGCRNPGPCPPLYLPPPSLAACSPLLFQDSIPSSAELGFDSPRFPITPYLLAVVQLGRVLLVNASSDLVLVDPRVAGSSVGGGRGASC